MMLPPPHFTTDTVTRGSLGVTLLLNIELKDHIIFVFKLPELNVVSPTPNRLWLL